jgi:hypothetical protein
MSTYEGEHTIFGLLGQANLTQTFLWHFLFWPNFGFTAGLQSVLVHPHPVLPSVIPPSPMIHLSQLQEWHVHIPAIFYPTSPTTSFCSQIWSKAPNTALSCHVSPVCSRIAYQVFVTLTVLGSTGQVSYRMPLHFTLNFSDVFSWLYWDIFRKEESEVTLLTTPCLGD